MGALFRLIFFQTGEEKLTKTNNLSFFDLSARDIMGNLISFEQFSTKKLIMIVNVASK